MSEDKNYILVEIWKAKPAWLALSATERGQFVEQQLGPFIGRFIEAGAEIVGCVMNDDDVADRLDYTYMAAWKMPNKEMSDQIIAEAAALGFLEYFEQVNFSGNVIAPDVMNSHMINL